MVLAICVLLVLSGCAMPGSLERPDLVSKLETLAENGDADSQYKLGLLYTIESQWILDHNRGYRWFLAAAEQGHAEAQYMAGMAKLNAIGTFFDRKGSVSFFRSSAQQGHARAQYYLAKAYLNGAGVKQDKTWGRQWLEQAAWGGHKEAQFLLGALFAGGVGGQANNAEAWHWLKKAVDNKHQLAEPALENLSKRLTAGELAQAKVLLAQPEPEGRSPYKRPRMRYVQSVLNQLGYSAGDEDGLPGSKTMSAFADYVQEYKLPRETRVLQLVEFLRGR